MKIVFPKLYSLNVIDDASNFEDYKLDLLYSKHMAQMYCASLLTSSYCEPFIIATFFSYC